MTNHVTFSAAMSREAAAEFRIGLRSAPSLADHGFQDMVVLPGSYYIEMARCVDRALFKRVAGRIQNASFDTPIILSADDTLIKVAAREHGDRVEYTFHEANVGEPATHAAARLEIDESQSMAPEQAAAFSIEAFQQQSDAVIEAERFYRRLRENGNQYGPRFRNVSSIWLLGDQCLGKISFKPEANESEPHGLDPAFLDAVTQLLAVFVRETGRTFVLRSIEKVEITDVDLPAILWAHATLLSQEDGLLGDIRVFDETGKPYLELSGVAFALLERADAATETPAATLVIGANFTAEPLEDSLNFWSDHFGVETHIEFAPYNQIFQQLLDTDSAFSKNSGGANAVLLNLQEWAGARRHATIELDKERAERCFGNHPKHTLPNGLEIVHLNRYETDYLYREIFEDQCYLRHGIRLRDGGTVVDIGANIGLFSLFVTSRCPNAKIYAFEPAPIVYELLQANCKAYGSNARAFNLGVSDRRKTATFTFYEKSSVFSGFHADENQDRAAIQTVVRNMLNRETIAGESLDEYVGELTADRLRGRVYECGLTSVSDIIRENRIDRIDLLKIDAEKSELDIINGIAESDWPKIDQIVMEIHDPTGETVQSIKALLHENGYRCAVDHETLLEHSGLFNLYAARSGPAGDIRCDSDPHHAADSADELKRNVRDFAAALRSFMTRTTAPLLLCFCPLTPAGENDAPLRSAIEDAEQVLTSEAATLSNVHVIGSSSLLRAYPIDDYYDPHGHRLGHMPYTPQCYAAIGTALIRSIFSLKREPRKVIVLDCDNTLWKGICGEDGARGIELTQAHRALQQFMIAQMNAGMLLCLCSKNNESDVLDVFDRRNDMLLKREHLVSWRINWNAKSANINSLARELNLGLDSFIFIDDNPVDCAEVKVHCPEVLTLQLPQDPNSFASFLNHMWVFDHAGGTMEDQNRTRMYRENSSRRRYLEQSLSLKDFVKGLELRVDISEATEDQIGRVSQQTFRTNQFNFTTLRRSENEIKNFLKREDATCLVARVADRFGDYGLVGVLMCETEADAYKVDTFLLSCRVLGRGVEHALVSWLGRRAVAQGKSFVEFTYRPTGKNLPALEFMRSIGAPYRNDAETSWTFPAEALAGVEYDPDARAPTNYAATPTDETLMTRPASGFGFAAGSERLQEIGEKLCDIDRLTSAIEQYRLKKQSSQSSVGTEPGDGLETALANIWRKVLGRPQIGLDDNFFEVGGTSLRAVQVIAQIKKELKQNLSIVGLFECPTVKLLAAKLTAGTAVPAGEAQTSAAVLRGRQRRYNTTRRDAT